MPSPYRFPSNSNKRKQKVSNREHDLERPQFTSNDLKRPQWDSNESSPERVQLKKNKLKDVEI